MPPLCCRFQAAIAIHELSLTRSAAEVVFPAVQPTDDRCALENEKHRRFPELHRVAVRAIAPQDSEPFEPADVGADGRHARSRLAAELPERQPRVVLKGFQNPNVKGIEIHDLTSRRSSLKLCPRPVVGMLALHL